MTFFVDVSGMRGVGLTVYGGEEEYWAAKEGRDPPVCNFKPKINNVAPRADAWQKSRNNTQTAPRSGPDSHCKPEVSQDRAPLFAKPITKMTAS